MFAPAPPELWPAATVDTKKEGVLPPAVEAAVAFLRLRQFPTGEFATLLGRDRTMAAATLDSSPFVTAHVLAVLAKIDDARVAEMRDRAGRFLLGEMEFGGVWRYWSTGNFRHARLPPDLDDTACISHALVAACFAPPDNHWAFRASRDSHGRFTTWLLPRWRNVTDGHYLLRRIVGRMQALARGWRTITPPDEDSRFRVMHIRRDDVDPVVNANVILYLGERPLTQPAIAFVRAAVTAEMGPRSLYYEDNLASYHAVSRAFHEAAPSLATIADHVVAAVRARVRDDAPLQPMQAALAALTFANFAAPEALWLPLVEQVRATQRKDGGWPAEPYYNVWGSEELTTAFCLEALMRASQLRPAAI